jgi:peptide/nickel transport system permease protein
MSFGWYFVRRLVLVVPTLFGVSLISFLLTVMLPGNPAMVKAGPFATPEYLHEVERQMGLDQPIPVQYERYVTGLLRGDLGESASTGRPVLQDFVQRLPATLELTLASLLLAILLGVPLGVLSALHREKLIDHFGRIIAVAGVALPSFWTGLLLIYVFFYMLDVAPAPLGRLASDVAPPISITGLYVPDALPGTGRRWVPALRTSRCRRSRWRSASWRRWPGWCARRCWRRWNPTMCGLPGPGACRRGG